MAILYLDGQSGLSGDMTVAALLDLGADRDQLLNVLKSLPVGGYRLEISRVLKNHLAACDFNVIPDAPAPGRHGGDQPPKAHQSSEAQARHRNLDDIKALIDRSRLSPRAKATAKTIFNIVAEAEAKAHGLPVGQVHFHEVGALDSIIDIAAAAFCLDNLNITEAVIGTLSEGVGQVRCQHGWLPVPVPAVVNILAAHGLPLTITGNHGEMITPTGAAIAAAIKTRAALPGQFTISKVGLGAGKKDFRQPNLLRAFLLEEATPVAGDEVWVLETNFDDCSAEALAFTLEELFRAGAKDAFFVPVFMKKNRPAYLLKVICGSDALADMERIIFTHTTTLGLRKQRWERALLEREIIPVETRWGPGRVKKALFNGRAVYHPEYESVKKLCRASGQPFAEIYETLKQRAQGG